MAHNVLLPLDDDEHKVLGLLQGADALYKVLRIRKVTQVTAFRRFLRDAERRYLRTTTLPPLRE